MAKVADPIPDPKAQATVWGRLYWDDMHTSPWVPFANVSAYTKWAATARRIRPGTKTEYQLLNPLDYTADRLLRRLAELAKDDLL